MDKLEETDEFYEKYNLSRVSQEEIEKMNTPITNTEIKTLIKKSSNKSPVSDSLKGKLYHKFREELTHMLLKLFQKTAEEGKLPNSFYEATITLIPKCDKHTHTHKITSQYH